MRSLDRSGGRQGSKGVPRARRQNLAASGLPRNLASHPKGSFVARERPGAEAGPEGGPTGLRLAPKVVSFFQGAEAADRARLKLAAYRCNPLMAVCMREGGKVSK
jgi:hypothetical protein